MSSQVPENIHYNIPKGVGVGTKPDFIRINDECGEK
jgi:hypothetical protein